MREQGHIPHKWALLEEKNNCKGKETALCLSDELSKTSALVWLETRSKHERKI